MSRTPVTLGLDATLGDALALMAEKNIGGVYVVDSDSKLLGIVSERDLLRDLVTHKGFRGEIGVREVMSQNVRSVSPETSMHEAARTMIMSKGRLVVTKDKKIVGVITATDLVKAFSSGPENRSVSEMLTQKVKTLDSSRSAFDAVQLMFEKGIGSIVVTKEGRPYGIFTERDLLRILKRRAEERIIDIKLEDTASRPLVTAPFGITAREAAALMISNKIKRLPLVKAEKLVAIITARDIVDTYVSTGLPMATTSASD